MKTNFAEKCIAASGIIPTRRYNQMLDRYAGEFKKYLHSNGIVSDDAYVIGDALNNFLWERNPKRAHRDIYNFAYLLDNYESGKPCGNCVSLTALYNIMAEEMGLDVYTLAPESHLLSRIKSNGLDIHNENTIPDGFGLNHIEIPETGNIAVYPLPEHPNDIIPASIYYSRAKDAVEMMDIDSAWHLCLKARENAGSTDSPLLENINRLENKLSRYPE